MKYKRINETFAYDQSWTSFLAVRKINFGGRNEPTSGFRNIYLFISYSLTEVRWKWVHLCVCIYYLGEVYGFDRCRYSVMVVVFGFVNFFFFFCSHLRRTLVASVSPGNHSPSVTVMPAVFISPQNLHLTAASVKNCICMTSLLNKGWRLYF